MTYQRSSHAALNLEGRWPKARKIDGMLRRHMNTVESRPSLLEVGTGSGAIAHYFAQVSENSYDVHAVDVLDQRQVREGYRFCLVQNAILPYEAGMFDAVISNHVIEHVGDEDAQRAHLAELHRVLKPGGVGYLATPNRWQLIEPHFHLPFLSWLPSRWRSAYVRTAGRGSVYDCRPLRHAELERLLRETGFGFENVGVEALRETLAIEHAESWITRPFRWIPNRLLFVLRGLNPTHVYIVRRTNATDTAPVDA